MSAACGGPAGDGSGGVAQAQGKASPSGSPKPSSAGKVVAAYLSVHEALAADNQAAARTAFVQVKDGLSAQLISNATVLARATKAAAAGAAAKDLDAARKAFGELSAAFVDWLKAQPSPATEALQLANCPMAFGTGAKWFQRGDKIHNPYYGSEMPSCGTIDAQLKPGDKLK